jgi:uncharacterized protein (DUF305 family)
MELTTYVRHIESLIAEHQAVQMNNPPSSTQWQNASAEIHRLARLITEEVHEEITRIGQHIYEDFQAGRVDFETCEASLNTLSELTDGELLLGIPE